MSKKTVASKPCSYQAPAVHKAFRLLKTVAKSQKQLGLTELAQQLGFSKSTTHGLVHALVREGALAQHPKDRKLFIGSTIYNLAFSEWDPFSLSDTVRQMINKMRDQITETVFLGALINKFILVAAVAEAEGPLKISATPGTRLPLFAGAVGKVFLANGQTAWAKKQIRESGLPRYTPKSIVDEALYLSELEKVRANGYAVDDEEYLSGVRAVAVALGNCNGPPMAAWIAGLSGTMNKEKIRLAVETVMSIADLTWPDMEKEL